MRKILALIIIYALAGWINGHAPSEKEIQVKYEKLMNFANEQYQVTDEENFSLASENNEIEVENKIEKIEEKSEIQEKSNENVNVLEKNEEVKQNLPVVTQTTQPQESKNDNEVVETTVSTNNYQEPTTENLPTVEEHKEIENVETFVENKQMEQKIIDYINSHPSENMSKYGYTVVVDNSITNLTTGFTFTEVRADSLLRFKAGIIKVYARDYLVNGNLQWTQCYIF